jgi:hypothetical protein
MYGKKAKLSKIEQLFVSGVLRMNAARVSAGSVSAEK